MSPRVDRDFPPAVREAVRVRADWRCEVCKRSPIDHFHHRLTRSQGGMGTLENCLAVCLLCHAHIHDQPAHSYEQGWLIRGAGRVA